MTGRKHPIENAPYESIRHGPWTIEGWSRAGVQSYWRIPELKVGFDLGAIPWEFTSTPTWFISHCHIDHLLALPGLLARRGMMKFDPPTIVVPTETVEQVENLLNAWRVLDHGRQSCRLVGMAPGDQFPLSEYHRVTAFATTHPVPSRGYILWEIRNKLKPEYADLDGEALKKLKQEGVALTHEVPVPLICYTGDTSPDGLDNEPALYEAKVLITELSFARPDQTPARIHEFGHLHLEDFAERQDRFRNELIIAAHVTTRDEPDEVRRLMEARLPASLSSRIRVWGA
jgi:ribonuclease Z